jgi:hypothetical protein
MDRVSGKPDFSSNGAGNDSLGAAGVTIGSAGLLMSGYALLDKNGKLTNALSDAFGKMTIDPTGYFSLNDPGSYISIDDSTTRLSKDRLLFKTGTFSNMILNLANLSYSNGIFSLCNQIALTATSISNLTNVSCSSNLTVLGVSSNGITAVGNNPLYLGDGNKGLIYSGALSTYNLNFTSTDGPVLYGWNGGFLASAAPGYGGNFAIRQSNLTGIAYWTSSGLGVFKSNPVVPLDVVGSANISGSLSTSTHSNSGNLQSSYIQSTTHSNSGNLQIGGTLSVNNLTGMTQEVWNNTKLGTWNYGGSNYHLIATSPNSGAGNSAGGLRISGTIGGFFAGNLCQVDATITCRGGVSFFGTGFGAVQQASQWADIVVYNSNNSVYQYFLATFNQFTGFDLTVSCGDQGLGTILQEATAIPFCSNLTVNSSNSIFGTVLNNLQIKTETATMMTTISSNTTVNGTLTAAVLQGSLAFSSLTSVPPLLSNSSSIGWSNIVNIPSYASLTQYQYTSNQASFGSNSLASYATLAQYQYTSNQSYFSSNALASVASSGNYLWSSNALRLNVNDASFSSNVSVGLGLTADSVLVNNLLVNNSINAYDGISSGADIISTSPGGNNLGTSGSPWGGLNTLTASLGDATTTTLSNSGVISLNSGDSDKIVLTSVGSSASKIAHGGGWSVKCYAGYNTATCGQHIFYTAYNGGFTNRMYINDNAVNITNKLAINQSTDSGVNRGLWWWNDTYTNWTSYFAFSGGTRSSSGGAACTSLDRRTTHHHCARAANSATQGFLWENASEQCLLSLIADTGNLFAKGYVSAPILKGSLDYTYLSNVPSLGTSAQSTFASNAGAWSSNNCVKGSTLSNASYPIMITATTPRLGLLWNGGTSSSVTIVLG